MLCKTILLLIGFSLSMGALPVAQDDPTQVMPVRWVNIGYELIPGEEIGIAAGGTIALWPDCAETQDERGYADLDCSVLEAVEPTGTDVLGPTPATFPLPDAPIGALIGRFGDTGQPFLIGTGTDMAADPPGDDRFGDSDGGLLYLAINDDGTFTTQETDFYDIRVRVEYDGDLNFFIPANIDAWVDTGFAVEAEAGFALNALGLADLYFNCAGDVILDDPLVEATPEADPITGDAPPDPLIDVPPSGTTQAIFQTVQKPLPDANHGALLVRFADGEARAVGESGAFSALSAGTIQFRVNDGLCVPENDGGFTVSINPVIPDPVRGGRPGPRVP